MQYKLFCSTSDFIDCSCGTKSYTVSAYGLNQRITKDNLFQALGANIASTKDLLEKGLYVRSQTTQFIGLSDAN